MPETTAVAPILAICNTDPQPVARACFARLGALTGRELIISGRVFEDPSPGTRALLRSGPDPGRAESWRPLAAAPAVRVFVGGCELTLERGELLGFWQRMSLADGLYEAELTLRDPAGRTTRLQTMRFIPLQRPRCVLVRYVVAPLDHHAGIEIVAGLAARPLRDGPPQEPPRFDAPQPECIVATGANGRLHLRAQTRLHRRTRVAGVAHRIEHDAAWTVITCPGRQRSVIEYALEVDPDGPAPDASAGAADFYKLLETSRRLWRRRWERLDPGVRESCAADAAVARAVAGMLAALPADE